MHTVWLLTNRSRGAGLWRAAVCMEYCDLMVCCQNRCVLMTAAASLVRQKLQAMHAAALRKVKDIHNIRESGPQQLKVQIDRQRHRQLL